MAVLQCRTYRTILNKRQLLLLISYETVTRVIAITLATAAVCYHARSDLHALFSEQIDFQAITEVLLVRK